MRIEEQLSPEQVGSRVEDVRTLAQLTQDQLAELLGVSHQSLSHIERGRLKSVNDRRLRLIAKTCAGKGHLEDVPNEAIEDYLSGEKDSLTVTIQGRFIPAKRKEAPAEAGASDDTSTNAVSAASVSSNQMSYFGHERVAGELVHLGASNDDPGSDRQFFTDEAEAA